MAESPEVRAALVTLFGAMVGTAIALLVGWLSAGATIRAAAEGARATENAAKDGASATRDAADTGAQASLGAARLSRAKCEYAGEVVRVLCVADGRDGWSVCSDAGTDGLLPGACNPYKDPVPSCIAGRRELCRCPKKQDGFQDCDADGRFSRCECPDQEQDLPGPGCLRKTGAGCVLCDLPISPTTLVPHSSDACRDGSQLARCTTVPAPHVAADKFKGLASCNPMAPGLTRVRGRITLERTNSGSDGLATIWYFGINTEEFGRRDFGKRRVGDTLDLDFAPDVYLTDAGAVAPFLQLGACEADKASGDHCTIRGSLRIEHLTP